MVNIRQLHRTPAEHRLLLLAEISRDGWTGFPVRFIHEVFADEDILSWCAANHLTTSKSEDPHVPLILFEAKTSPALVTPPDKEL